MSKEEDWVQSEEDSELLIYEEWQRYVMEREQEDEEDREYWTTLGRCTE